MLLLSTESIFATGTGISSDFYIITTAVELNDIRNDLTAYYKSVNNIDETDYLSSTGVEYNDGKLRDGTDIGSFVGRCFNNKASRFYATNATFNDNASGDIGALSYQWKSNGREIEKPPRHAPLSEQDIDVSGLANDVYRLKVRTSDGEAARKIVING